MNYIITDLDNGLSPVQCQAITTTSADIFSIVILVTDFIETWIKIQTYFYN